MNEIEYHVTGILINGRRFPVIKTTNIFHAYGINLYRGTVWLVINGKRTKLKEVYN